jgi:S-adenosylmethionine synthetase
MRRGQYLEPSCYAVESVLEGHPDKVCDQIADAILDAYLAIDRAARVAIECLGCGDTLFLAGEVSSTEPVDVESIAREVYRAIGYTEQLRVVNMIQAQSSQLAGVVESGAAGDQGVIYGFACRTEFNALPYGVWAVSGLARDIDLLRRRTNRLRPDGKVQLCVRGDHAAALVISVQHDPDESLEALRELIAEEIVRPWFPSGDLPRLLINHKSAFVKGGFANDTGLTGRKLAVDTYCGLAPHGGGSFSGKDPSKVDRSGAYMARFVAKSLVASGLASSCTVLLAYVFGEPEPVLVDLQTDEPGQDAGLLRLVCERYDFRPPAIAERFALREVHYQRTAAYGHFTDPGYPWEKAELL